MPDFQFLPGFGGTSVPLDFTFCNAILRAGGEKMAKRPNGTGPVLKLKFRDKATGELKESTFWYIFYSANGQQHREATGTEDHAEAKKLLEGRLAEHALGIRPTID